MRAKNIAILFFADNNRFGMGHYYRSLVMAEELKNRGHNVLLLSNLQIRGWTYYQVRQEFLADDLYHVFDQFSAEWFLVDTPKHPPSDVFDYVKKYGMQTMMLNASFQPEETYADIAIIQGNLKTGREPASDVLYLHGKDYVLLRPDLSKYEHDPDANGWFVFGGSADKMGLLPAFSRAMQHHKAFYIYTDEKQVINVAQSDRAILAKVNNAQGFIELMQQSSKACTAMGMTTWELAYFGIPVYIFSLTKHHLEFALGLEELGLASVYPKVGLPSEAKMRSFLRKVFKPDLDNKPDLLASSRIADEMGC